MLQAVKKKEKEKKKRKKEKKEKKEKKKKAERKLKPNCPYQSLLQVFANRNRHLKNVKDQSLIVSSHANGIQWLYTKSALNTLIYSQWLTLFFLSKKGKTTKYDKMQNKEQAEKQRFLTLVQTKTRSCPTSNYELFNHSNVSIRYWSWNYRGCWHQTGPPMDPR